MSYDPEPPLDELLLSSLTKKSTIACMGEMYKNIDKTGTMNPKIVPSASGNQQLKN